MAGTTGLEPAASAVTGQRSNQLNYVPNLFHRVCGKPFISCLFLLSTASPVATISTRYNRNPGVNGQEVDRKPTPKSCCTPIRPSASVHAPLANCNRPNSHRYRLSARSQPRAKDYLINHQITAEGRYVAHPDLTLQKFTGWRKSASPWTNSSTRLHSRSVTHWGPRQMEPHP
jgi:hypothetical protein